MWHLPADGDSNERNFHHCPYVAEPVAVITCLIFCVLSARYWWAKQQFVQNLPADLAAAFQRTFFCHLASGVAGVFYHTTVKWIPQLFDR